MTVKSIPEGVQVLIPARRGSWTHPAMYGPLHGAAGKAVVGHARSNPRRYTMIVEAQVTINGSKAAIWAAITDIEKDRKSVV